MYIIDYNQQNQLIKEMTQLRRDVDNLVVYFHHAHTGRMWKSFFPRATAKELGPKLLRHEPVPASLEEHLSICLSEDVPENAIGLGTELSVQIERWPEIIQVLEENHKNFVPVQVRRFLKYLKSSRFKENISQLGINGEELELTYKELKSLKWRTRKIRVKSFLF